MLFSVARIETKTPSDEKVATGFLYRHTDQNCDRLFLVTNKHVVKDAIKGRVTFVAEKDEKPLLGHKHTIEIDHFEEMWIGHPDPNIDVAVANFSFITHFDSDKLVYFTYISKEELPTEETLNDLGPLEEIVFVGYPYGIWDTINFLPIVRRGSTATPPSVDFCGVRKYLIDASVFPGSSGSPVYIYNAGGYSDGKGSLVIGSRLIFMGIISSTTKVTNHNKIIYLETETTKIPYAKYEQMIDLGTVFKPSTIIKTVQLYIENPPTTSKCQILVT